MPGEATVDVNPRHVFWLLYVLFALPIVPLALSQLLSFQVWATAMDSRMGLAHMLTRRVLYGEAPLDTVSALGKAMSQALMRSLHLERAADELVLR